MAMHSCEFSYLRGEMTSGFIEERYDIFGAETNFPAQKQGCFSKHMRFFCGLFLWPGTVEQKLKCRTTVEQEKICQSSGTGNR